MIWIRTNHYPIRIVGNIIVNDSVCRSIDIVDAPVLIFSSQDEWVHKVIDVYEWVTGEQLTELGPAECPDFICARPTGEKVGVELVRVMRDPEEAQFDRIVDKKFQAEPQETLDMIFGLVDDKDNKRSNNYGH